MERRNCLMICYLIILGTYFIIFGAYSLFSVLSLLYSVLPSSYSVLSSLYLGTLADRFDAEKIEPDNVISASDSFVIIDCHRLAIAIDNR